MTIELQNLGKRFNRNWIFRNITFTFQAGEPVAITGSNGSGKSTLLQVIAGALEKSEGQVNYSLGGNPVLPENHFRHLTMAAPYLELIEEYSLPEFLKFHFSLKPMLDGANIAAIIQQIGLTDSGNRPIRNFSSGMKQRVKLAQAFFSKAELVLLDEPTTNLDQAGIDLYHYLINNYSKNRLLIIASNSEQEISFCQNRLQLSQYKT